MVSASGSFSLATDDQLLAYTGTSTNPSFLAGFTNNNGWESTSSSSNTSALPSAIATAGTAITPTSNIENAVFNGTRAGVTTKSGVASAITAIANYTTNTTNTALTQSITPFTNNSQLTISTAGATTSGSTSTITSDLGRIVQGTTPSIDITISNGGTHSTIYSVTAANNGLNSVASGSAITGSSSAIYVATLQNNANGTGTTGAKSLTAVIDNGTIFTDLVTTGTGALASAGKGSQDANDTVTINATIVGKRVVTASNVNLGASIVGTPVSAVSNFTTTGTDDTRTRVSLATGAIAPNADGIGVNAGSAALFNSPASTATRTVSGAFSSVGLKNGTVGVPVSGEGLAGEGAYSDVSVGYSALVLDHSNGSFSDSSDVNSILLPDLGSIELGETYTGSLTVHNLKSALDGSPNGDYTASLEIKDVAFSGGDNVGALTIDPTAPIGGTLSSTFNFQFTPTTAGDFTSTFNLTVGDVESILGWSDNLGGLSFTISGNVFDVQAVPEPLTAAGVLLLTSRVLGRRNRLSL